MASRLPERQPTREDEITLSRPPSKSEAATKSSNGYASSPADSLKPNSAGSRPGNAPARRRYVFTDPVAFRYLEEDPVTVVLERRGWLKGYETYLVEQWACSRVHPTFVITTYTGDPNHNIVVGVLGVPADEAAWSPRMRMYFKAVSQYHARPQETNMGELMVTNLSAFPSALTVIPVPDGDIRRHRVDFIVNEDLKRLGCSGRSGLSLTAPAGATQAKFHQLYKTSDRNPIEQSVIELVKLCQVALMMFDKLKSEYADGLLCDITERAINDWWTEIGSEHYNIEPADGVLGPTTVAALLGMLMGARNRLNYYGAPVSKDAFDITNLKRGIGYFQKSQKLPKTKKLDRPTFDQLHRVTAKAAAGEGWGLPKTVKSTVAELSGKGGEMVMGMVGAREKAGIGEVETLDIDRFVSLVHGERAKWLWYGKARKGGTGEGIGKFMPENGNMAFGKDEHGGFIWSNDRPNSLVSDEEAGKGMRDKEKDQYGPVYSSKPPSSTASSIPENTAERDQHLRKAVFKSVTDKVSDARSGFGRIRDAVGLRGHMSKASKDEGFDANYYSGSTSNLTPGHSHTPSNQSIGRAFTWKNKPEEYHDGYRKDNEPTSAMSSSNSRNDPSPNDLKSAHPSTADMQAAKAAEEAAEAEAKWTAQAREIREELVTNEPSVAGSIYDEGDLAGPFLAAERDPHTSGSLLRRRHSIAEDTATHARLRNDAYWPRCMSFSGAEDAILMTWEDIGAWDHPDKTDPLREIDLFLALQKAKYTTAAYQRIFGSLTAIREQLGAWTTLRVSDVEELEDQAHRDQTQLQQLYYQLNEAYQSVRQSSGEILGDEREKVAACIREIETLDAKLEYEINALVSKVEDVEDGVAQFERQVVALEKRSVEVEKILGYGQETWVAWMWRMMVGMLGAVLRLLTGVRLRRAAAEPAVADSVAAEPATEADAVAKADAAAEAKPDAN